MKEFPGELFLQKRFGLEQIAGHAYKVFEKVLNYFTI